jgi:hypothetical protein
MTTRPALEMGTGELLECLDELARKITDHERVEDAESTQLRLGVHRLSMFAEHLDQLATAEPVEEPETLTRNDLNAKALEAGVESPEKLANKQAVIDAIQAAEQASAEPQATAVQGPSKVGPEPASSQTASSRI